MKNKIIDEKIKQAKKAFSKLQENNPKRLPPGQTLTNKFPILDLGIHPEIEKNSWNFNIFGLVKKELNLTLASLKKYKQITSVSDFHCVTHWSKFDVAWRGVLLSEILRDAELKATGKFATIHSYDDYTTNLPIEALLDNNVILAYELEGEELKKEHGGPVRLIVPKRYAWKSAKWIKSIEIHAENRPGFWEVRGYHNYANPWLEERYSGDE